MVENFGWKMVWISNGIWNLDFLMIRFCNSFSYCYGSDHSKTRPFKIQSLYCPNFKLFYFFIKPSNLFVSTGMCCCVDGAISRLESRAPRWRTWCPTMGRSNVDQIGECNGVWNQNSENRTPSEIGTFLCSDFELFSFQIVCLQPNV